MTTGWSHRRAALRLLAPVVAILAAMGGAVLAAAALSPGPPGAPPPDPERWARPAADRLAAAGLWPELAGADLGRDAVRADLDRAVAILTGLPAADPAPAAPASAWVVNRRIVAALGLEPERLALQALATDDGRRLALPPNFGSEVLVRELGLVHNRRRDDLERAMREPVRLADLASMVEPGARPHPRGPPARRPLPGHPAAGDGRPAARRRAGRAEPGRPALRLGRRLADAPLAGRAPGPRGLRLLGAGLVGVRRGGSR